jgi:NOL1/NOP2/sun family putative RNA methylase
LSVLCRKKDGFVFLSSNYSSKKSGRAGAQMAVRLPEPFLRKMRQLLQDQFADFLSSYENDRHYGLRVNLLKLGADEFARISPFPLEPVPWIREGFYFDGEQRPGKHPYYHAGLYYIQEPSAMLPVELLDVQPGERVLDLCAAPGGKAAQIAAKLKHTGVLVANDPHEERVKALVKNIELSGARGAVVLNERPERLAATFAGYFDKILVDAPCSGEGMFRKDEQMSREWSEDSPDQYASVQRELLAQAARMLAPGGTIVYSTCTFSPEENERVVAAFLREYPQFRVVPAPLLPGFAAGRPDWAGCALDGMNSVAGKQSGCEGADFAANGGMSGNIGGSGEADFAAGRDIGRELTGAVRLWPHLVRGEGHFAAVLKHDGPASASARSSAGGDVRAFAATSDAAGAHSRASRRGHKPHGSTAKGQPLTREQQDALASFAAGNGIALPDGPYRAYGERIFLPPAGLPELTGLRAARPGWYVGKVQRGRFEPSHALALGLEASAAGRTLDLTADGPEVVRYLKGETLEVDPSRLRLAPGLSAKGYVLVTVNGFPLGWGKWLNGLLKNEYPPGWRWS